ncbi:MAG TPA: hypothetical protein PL182_03255 [Pseudobdellovibrionaceae bacterium]|nr:hypothetical protein [Pseudobdellovibrionaceae bacterium]
MNRLQIHADLPVLGYATEIRDDGGRQIATMIGINEAALAEKPPYDLWSWKEQLNFGLSSPSDPERRISPRGPHVEESISGVEHSPLLHVVVHELNHLIDFMNSANKIRFTWPEAPGEEPYRVSIKHDAGSFGLLSWPAEYSFLSDNSDWPPSEISRRYPWLSRLCYYQCQQPIPLSWMEDIYAELGTTDFVTPYASTNSMDDFAEMMTVMTLLEQGMQFRIRGPEGKIFFDARESLRRPHFERKKEWIREFLRRPDLKYRLDRP